MQAQVKWFLLIGAILGVSLVPSEGSRPGWCLGRNVLGACMAGNFHLSPVAGKVDNEHRGAKGGTPDTRGSLHYGSMGDQISASSRWPIGPGYVSQ